MPNEVYRAAVDGLADLVPPRVAKRLVDEALRATRRTPEDVSLSAMRRLLLGPIRAELEGVLPPGAAGPGLKRVAATIAGQGEQPRRRRWWPLGRRGPDDAEAERDEPSGTADRSTPPVPALGSAAKAAAVAGPSTSLRATQVRRVEEVATAVAERPAPAAEPRAAATPKATRRPAPSPPPLPALDDALVERALREFGALETVRQVVAVRGAEVVLGSGEGLDEAALPGLALATSRLLGRDGVLRLFALERPSGALFLFPLRDGGLVVLTKPNVNIGAVLAARAALEEAA